MAAHAHQVRAVYGRADDLRGFQVFRDEHPGFETGPRRLRRHGVREIAGRCATDRLEAERGGRIDRRCNHAVFEGQRRVRDGVVLDPCAGHTQPYCEPGGRDKGGTARVERERGLAVKRQPLSVAPERIRTRLDLAAGGQLPVGIEHRIEWAETWLADRDGRGLMLCPARATALRPRTQRPPRQGRWGERSAHGATTADCADAGGSGAARLRRAARIDASSAGAIS